LSVFPIRVPPLRERREDVAPLARHFAAHFAEKLKRRVSGLSPAALQRLEHYEWPGNVRELQNVIERAVVITQTAQIEEDAILIRVSAPLVAGTPSNSVAPVRTGGGAAESTDATPAPPATRAPAAVPATLADAERAAIAAALEAAGWRISGRGGAAERLRVKPTTLHAKMKKLGIRRPTG
jgi:DNA-binding NtrC family response regulator